MDTATLLPVRTPVPISLYPTLATVLLSAGAFAVILLLIYEVTTTKHSKQLSQEVILSALASVCLGLGTLFLLLWTGVYV